MTFKWVTMRRRFPEDSNSDTERRENVKSRKEHHL
jgi:hypothetical protein